MNTITCDESHATDWDAFVHQHHDTWHYQRFGWKRVIERTYGHTCPYLACLGDHGMQGILPLAVVKSRAFGSSLTSLPFLDTAGVAATAPDARDKLVMHAAELAARQGVGYLELRQAKQIPGDYRVDTHKLSLTMPLATTSDEQWSALPSERRNRVRKARKAGLSSEVADATVLPEFYLVWSRNMRDLGSPAHSRTWFRSVFAEFPESVRLMIIRSDRECVGAAVMVEYKGTLAVPWVSSLREAFSKHPNDLLYWEAISHAIERGCTRFDFGRSTAGSGNHTYKTRWGAESSPIYWQYLALTGSEPHLPGDSDDQYSLASKIWKRLPVSVANWIGPVVRKGITK